jgi:hypothetical protein
MGWFDGASEIGGSPHHHSSSHEHRKSSSSGRHHHSHSSPRSSGIFGMGDAKHNSSRSTFFGTSSHFPTSSYLSFVSMFYVKQEK